MKHWQVAVLVFFVLGLIEMATAPSKDFQKKYPRNGLTDERLLQITDDCIHHPDELRCK